MHQLRIKELDTRIHLDDEGLGITQTRTAGVSGPDYIALNINDAHRLRDFLNAHLEQAKVYSQPSSAGAGQ